MTEEITNAGVVGLGVMGFDIAFLYSMKGYRTLAYDTAKTLWRRSPNNVNKPSTV